MPSKLPYMLTPGLIPKTLEKIQQARRPERFTQDLLETKLGHSGGSARAMIPLLKRIGFLGSDGAPTVLYDQFRNVETQGTAIAQGMKTAFGELFDRNEYVYELSREQLTALVVEVLGEEHGVDWWDKAVPEVVEQNAERNQKKELASGMTPRSTKYIDFTNFGELGEVIQANRDTFGDMFRDVLAVKRILTTLNSLRAPIAHCKALAEDEELRLHLGLRDWFRQME